jgi:hypothetical protein
MQSHLSTLNSAARLMLRRREHVTRHLQYLNWLPIRRRIDFKLGVLAYRLCQCCDRPLPPPPPAAQTPPLHSTFPPCFMSISLAGASGLVFALHFPFPPFELLPFELLPTATEHSRTLARWYGILCHPVSLLHLPFPSQEASVRAKLPNLNVYFA